MTKDEQFWSWYSAFQMANHRSPGPQDAYLAGARDFDSHAETLKALRDDGWSVAVHNDYRLDGVAYTFWLMTKGERALKGEGRTDAEALAQITARAMTPHLEEEQR